MIQQALIYLTAYVGLMIVAIMALMICLWVAQETDWWNNQPAGKQRRYIFLMGLILGAIPTFIWLLLLP